MTSEDLAIAHLRRFSIPLPDEASAGKKTPTDTPPLLNTPPPLVTPPPYISPTDKRRFFNDDSQNDENTAYGHSDSSSRRHRRKKKDRKRKNLGDHVTEPDKSNSDGGGGKAMCDTSDNYTGTEGEGSTYCEVSVGESGDIETEVPHRRLKLSDNVYVGSRRRSGSSSTRRPHKLKKQKPIVPGSPEDSHQDPPLEEDAAVAKEAEGNGEAESNEPLLDETDAVYQADVSRTYESVSEYVMQSDDVLLDTKCITNGYKNARRKQNDPDETMEFDMCGDIDDENTARLKLALNIHIGFRSFGMLTHGLVAGIAIAQCIFVFSYSTALRHRDNDIASNNSRATRTTTAEAARVLLGNYSQVAVLFQSLYYLFLAVSIVSILDRFINIDSDWTHLLQFLIAKPLRACALISYLLSFIFSVSLAELDDIISMYTARRDVTTAHQADTWKVLNMFRVVTSVVGWVSVAFSRHDDVTCATLEKILFEMRREAGGKYAVGEGREHSSPVRSLQDDNNSSRLEHAKM